MIKRILAGVLLVSNLSFGAIAFVNNVAVGGISTGATTAAVDMTGANFLAASVTSDVTSSACVFSSSPANTWTQKTAVTTTDTRTFIYYATNPTITSSMTFTCSGTATYPSVSVVGFSGVNTSSPFDQEAAGGGANSGTSGQPGSLTPGADNYLFVTAIGFGLVTTPAASVTIDLSFVIPTGATIAFSTGNHYGASVAYFIQTTAAAKNPTWSWTNSAHHGQTMDTFKPAIASTAPPQLLLLGVGE